MSPSDKLSAYSNWPTFDDRQIEAVQCVLRSGQVNYWTGDEGKKFEREFAEYIGTNHAIATSNGTVALELALRGLGVGSGDEVIVPCRTFIATASSVVACDARPVVADVDPDSQNITAETIEAQVSHRTKAIIVVHLAGRPCEMDEIRDVANRRGLYIVEDCAQAHGARYRGQSVGSLGDVAAFSFCQDKILTTGGEGGMLATNDEKLWKRAWAYKDHGKCYDMVHRPPKEPGFRWLHKSFGTNWRMTEMQAAIGRIQLRLLNEWVARRRANAARLEMACREAGLRIPSAPSHLFHSYYRFYAFAEEGVEHRDKIITSSQDLGVPCFSGSCGEIYREEAFTELRPDDRLPNARRLSETSLAWLVDQTIGPEKIERACQAIKASNASYQRLAA